MFHNNSGKAFNRIIYFMLQGILNKWFIRYKLQT